MSVQLLKKKKLNQWALCRTLLTAEWIFSSSSVAVTCWMLGMSVMDVSLITFLMSLKVQGIDAMDGIDPYAMVDLPPIQPRFIMENIRFGGQLSFKQILPLTRLQCTVR